MREALSLLLCASSVDDIILTEGVSCVELNVSMNMRKEINSPFLNKCHCIYLSDISLSCSVIVPETECTKTMVHLISYFF